MTEISLHIMDIVQNSITAGATLIEVSLCVSSKNDSLTVSVQDNGKGMSEEMTDGVTSPFVTTRTTRKVGLGIPLFAAGAQATGGSFHIESQEGNGTSIVAVYKLDHIDRPPIGDFAGTMRVLIVGNPQIDFIVNTNLEGTTAKLATSEIKQVLGEVPIDTPDVSVWIGENLTEMFPEKYKYM